MKFLDMLRKLGIVRYGVKAGTYSSGKDRPAEFLMDDVYDAQKDLTTKEDLARVAEAVKKTGGRLVLFWVALALGVVLMLFFAAAAGLSLWLFLTLGLWVAVLFLTHQFAYQGRYSYGGIIVLVVGAVVATLFVAGVSIPD